MQKVTNNLVGTDIHRLTSVGAEVWYAHYYVPLLFFEKAEDNEPSQVYCIKPHGGIHR